MTERDPRFYRNLLDKEIRQEEEKRQRLLRARRLLADAAADAGRAEYGAQRSIRAIIASVELLIDNEEAAMALLREKKGE